MHHVNQVLPRECSADSGTTTAEALSVPQDKLFTLDEVASHNTKNSVWISYDGLVCDITDYIKSNSHPGGNTLLLNYAGLDVTDAFRDVGHTDIALEILKKYVIGKVKGFSDKSTESITTTNKAYNNDIEYISNFDNLIDGVDFKKPILIQIYNLKKDQYISLTKKVIYTTDICNFFQNSFLELLSRASWWIVPSVWLPVAIILFNHTVSTYTGTFRFYACIYFLLGLFIWTFAEYVIHRFVFHFPESSLPDLSCIRLIHFLIHGVHHLLIKDKTRLVVPPAFFAILASPFYLASRVIFPKWLVNTIWPGVLTGYVIYDMIHYASHNFSSDETNYLSRMKRYHVMHHFRTPDKKFGVSSPFWDYVFKTSY